MEGGEDPRMEFSAPLAIFSEPQRFAGPPESLSAGSDISVGREYQPMSPSYSPLPVRESVPGPSTGASSLTLSDTGANEDSLLCMSPVPESIWAHYLRAKFPPWTGEVPEDAFILGPRPYGFHNLALAAKHFPPTTRLIIFEAGERHPFVAPLNFEKILSNAAI
ncbi:hypothetical protein PUN28_020209 [Cardiocondyla obscurior]|uniref:Uncharacterized protein n=1 Tax=Cardiocondyla obscurior TaxID=286306 RepID=A0AAW2E6V0_9HYME